MIMRAARFHPSWWDFVLGFMIAASGYGLSCWLFFPGLATHDTLAVYDQAHTNTFGDWQPPLLGQLWVWLEPVIGYGPKAMFLPTNALYWGGLWILFAALRQAGAQTAWLCLVIGFLPPVFVLSGIVWRDVIFSTLWLFAVALALISGRKEGAARWVGTAFALFFFMIGIWLRPNALFGAPPLLAFIFWPKDWRWKRLFIIAIPAMIAIEGSAYVLNYKLLHASRDNALHSIFVYDLVGITHFTGQNAFPVPEWTPQEVNIIKTKCYDPNYWDAIWWDDCSFAMRRLDRNEPPGTKLFGSTTLRDAWMKALITHPIEYAKHRLTFFTALMTNKTMVLFDQNQSRQWRFYIIKGPAYRMFESSVIWLHDHTPLFRGLTWLILALGSGLASLRLSNGRAKAAALALSSSGVVYTLSYLVFGVAAEYRYIYWTALSSLAAATIVLAKWELRLRERVAQPPSFSSAGRIAGA